VLTSIMAFWVDMTRNEKHTAAFDSMTSTFQVDPPEGPAGSHPDQFTLEHAKYSFDVRTVGSTVPPPSQIRSQSDLGKAFHSLTVVILAELVLTSMPNIRRLERVSWQ
jgi:hypothetical protein